MAEEQVHSITVIKEKLYSRGGGGMRRVEATITVDEDLPLHYQKVAVTHEILGCLLGVIVPTDTLAEIAEHIIDGLDSLGARCATPCKCDKEGE